MTSRHDWPPPATVDGDQSAATTLLRSIVQSRRLTREETLRLLHAHAKALGVTGFRIDRRQLDRWLAGQVKTTPHPAACRILEAEFGYPVEVLLAPVPHSSRDGRREGTASTPDVAPPGCRQQTGYDHLATARTLATMARELARQAERFAAALAEHAAPPSHHDQHRCQCAHNGQLRHQR